MTEAFVKQINSDFTPNNTRCLFLWTAHDDDDDDDEWTKTELRDLSNEYGFLRILGDGMPGLTWHAEDDPNNLPTVHEQIIDLIRHHGGEIRLVLFTKDPVTDERAEELALAIRYENDIVRAPDPKTCPEVLWIGAWSAEPPHEESGDEIPTDAEPDDPRIYE